MRSNTTMLSCTEKPITVRRAVKEEGVCFPPKIIGEDCLHAKHNEDIVQHGEDGGCAIAEGVIHPAKSIRNISQNRDCRHENGKTCRTGDFRADGCADRSEFQYGDRASRRVFKFANNLSLRIVFDPFRPDGIRVFAQ